ncbi:MAG: methyltransferase domain-containing protein [Methanosarcinales archaeon]|nr:methyltransferase domain-containing protein [Methanosarcinales archaeon]
MIAGERVREGGRYHHRGRSCRGVLDAEKVIKMLTIVEGCVFLDLGCGDGFLSLAASAAVGSSGRVYALDVQREPLQALHRAVTERRIASVDPILGDAVLHLPLGDARVDLCLMANVFHGFHARKEVPGVMGEVARVLRPGGLAAVVDFKKEETPFGPPLRIRLYAEEIEEMMAPFGLRGEWIRDVGINHYLLLMVRV